MYDSFETNCADPKYLKQRAVITPYNKTVVSLLPGPSKTYLSRDSISQATDQVSYQELLYPTEFLNSLKFLGVANHELELKVGANVMILRNLNQSYGLCNGS